MATPAGHYLRSSSETDSVVTHIEFGVEFSNENVSQNPQWSIRRWDVNTHEARHTNRFSHLSNLQNGIFSNFRTTFKGRVEVRSLTLRM